MMALLHWHWTRWLRLLIGAGFVGQGFAAGDAFAYGAGALFILQAFLNTGCCLAGACAPSPLSKAATNNDFSYQEIR